MDPTVAIVAELFKEVHGAIRKVVADLDAEALAWTPGPETNSLAVLVVHTLGSEAAVLRLVRGLPSVRDRDAEFVVRPATATDLLAQIDEADALLDEHANAITGEDLVAIRERPDRDPQVGIHWLISNYGHAREHWAHMQLTKQLYRQRTGTS
jgi:hypothetical protein